MNTKFSTRNLDRPPVKQTLERIKAELQAVLDDPKAVNSGVAALLRTATAGVTTALNELCRCGWKQSCTFCLPKYPAYLDSTRLIELNDPAPTWPKESA